MLGFAPISSAPIVGGQPMGNAATSDVARVVNENAEIVASYKASTVVTTPPGITSLLDSGDKVWGCNLIPTPEQIANNRIADWTQLFVTWDWAGWVKPMVDVVASMGCNTVGLLGCADALHAGTLTQSQINARWVQLGDYCASLGLALYPKPSIPKQLSGMTNEEIADYTISILNALDGRCEVIACDIITEADNWNLGGIGTQTAADRCNAILALVKAASAVPCTFSSTLNWSSSAAKAWAAKLQCDFLDFHPYVWNGWATPLNPTDLNYWASTYPGVTVLFGEGGQAHGDGTAFIDGIGNAVVYGGSAMLGWCAWAAQDSWAASANRAADDMGFVNAAWAVYDAPTQIMKKYVNSESPSMIWVDDAIPPGPSAGGNNEDWNWVTANPSPYSGTRAHQSALAAGMHQHWFYNATATLAVAAGDTLFAYVYIDPANPPREIMLQWYDGTWEHRAYWGANLIAWGADGSASLRYMGPLPSAGQWVRLAVPASQLGLEGRTLSGMAFTLYDGRATWDYAGKESGQVTPPVLTPFTGTVPPGVPLHVANGLIVGTY